MVRFDPYFEEIRTEFDINGYDLDDPGATNPVDLCASCAASFDEEMTCDHPPYEEALEGDDYRCEMCSGPLTEADNDYVRLFAQ